MKGVEVPGAGPGREWWLNSRVEVRGSRIEGRGLVAVERIAAGALVERLGGVFVTDPELRQMIESASAYVDSVSIEHNLNLVLPAGSPLHFGNHSCDPTLWWVDPLMLVARVDIGADSEVTVDYGTLTDDPDFRMDCTCGAASCRGQITGLDWKLAELQQRYGDHWVPVLRRRITSTESQVPSRLDSPEDRARKRSWTDGT
jgi:hypothetical protein